MTNDANSSRVTVPQLVLPLPGELDDTEFFISNSPEIVLQSGILLSTFAPGEKACAAAHLDYSLSGHFDVFFHHITDAAKAESPRTLYLGLLIGNCSDAEVNVRVLNAVSYLTRPDAPFAVLEAVVDNADAKVYAGPGDRVMMDFLRGSKQKGWNDSISLPAHQMKLLCSLPLPVNSMFHQLNARSALISLLSDGPIQMALLSTFAESRGFGTERKPELRDWLEILKNGSLVQPRDKLPTSPGAPGELIYGRVAGVARGSIWRGTITNDAAQSRISIAAGETLSYPISTVYSGTLGTNQIQAAPMIIRYADTAHQAHGNYGVLYDLTLPIYNPSDSELLVGFSFQSPLKNWNETTGLRFLTRPGNATVFRGNVKFEWNDGQGEKRTKFIHLVQKQGQMQDSLVELAVSPQEQIDVKFELRYPPDCTPPQVLTILAKNKQSNLPNG